MVEDILFEMGPPTRCQWFHRGREATRAEVLEGFDKGVSILRAQAQENGPWYVEEFERRLGRAMQLLPK